MMAAKNVGVYQKPVPVIDEDSKPYWDAARQHKLKIQQCSKCMRFIFYPRALCPYCENTSLEWQELNGRGIIYSFTVVRFAISSAYRDDVPYITALVELNEGIRIMANVVECAPETVKIGMQVEVVFEDVTSDVSLPQFRLSEKV